MSQVDPHTINQAGAPEGWEEESLGFPPYWNPEVGKSFRGVVMNRDERDPEFIRYVLLATAPVTCATGPADESDVVHVAPGGKFTVSAYASLRLDELAGLEVFVKCIGKREIKNGKQELWQWQVFLSPEAKKQLAARRAEQAKELPAAF
jgi:hypothetical protein